MSYSEQELVDKILSLNYQELAKWIKSRLRGNDPYFPTYEGYETNLSEFLAESFQHIKNETFRANFLEILGDLTCELWGLSKNKKGIEEYKDYIYELLSLCAGIRQFENKRSLYRIARSGTLKGFNVFDVELHQLLLTTLASYRVVGDYDFWVEQMMDDSNKYYANAAFYALVNRKYDLDALFEHIDIFVDRFKGEIDLSLGVKALINDYGSRAITKHFKMIESKLTPEQRNAVNSVFSKLKYVKPYKVSPVGPDKQTGYSPAKPVLSMVGEKKIEYGTPQPLREKAGDIFTAMGFDVEFNREIAGISIDIFIKKKKTFGYGYECYFCKCLDQNRKGNKTIVEDVLKTREVLREEFDGCDAVIISQKGFTKEAVKSAQKLGIEIISIEKLDARLTVYP